jgi:SET domain-containing protein
MKVHSFNLLFQLQHNQAHYVVDAFVDDGTFGRLINHSKCHFNLKVTKHVVEGYLETLLFVATKRIAPGDELLFDYGGMYDKDIGDCVEGCERCMSQ